MPDSRGHFARLPERRRTPLLRSSRHAEPPPTSRHPPDPSRGGHLRDPRECRTVVTGRCRRDNTAPPRSPAVFPRRRRGRSRPRSAASRRAGPRRRGPWNCPAPRRRVLRWPGFRARHSPRRRNRSRLARGSPRPPAFQLLEPAATRNPPRCIQHNRRR